MNIQTQAVRHEQMRIAGVRVDTDERVNVVNPYTSKVIGTVPAARPEHVRDAFAKAKAFKSKLTRYERQQILLRTADILARRSLRFEIGRTERMKMSNRLGKSMSQSKMVTAPIATKEYMTKK